MDKPVKCCAPGEYTCQIPMPLNGRRQEIDFCIADIVTALAAANITTVASCCGHGKIDGSIALDDGRELTIRRFDEKNHVKKDSRWVTQSWRNNNRSGSSRGEIKWNHQEKNLKKKQAKTHSFFHT